MKGRNQSRRLFDVRVVMCNTSGGDISAVVHSQVNDDLLCEKILVCRG